MLAHYSHHLLHVGCRWLARLLPLGDLPPQLVVLLQDLIPGLLTQAPDFSLVCTAGGGALSVSVSFLKSVSLN